MTTIPSPPFPCNYRRSPHCTGYTTSGYFIPDSTRITLPHRPEITLTFPNRIICRPCLEYIIMRDTHLTLETN